MLLEVHVSRFVEWVPSTIVSLAYSPLLNILAVARRDGNIEFWRQLPSNSKWFTHSVIAGSMKTATRNVVWAGSRLFSAGLNGMIIEWNPKTLCAIRVCSSNGGAAWDFVVSPDNSELAVACDDGGVRLFDISDDQLQYKYELPRQKTKCLSVAYHEKGKILVSAYGNGDVRLWEVGKAKCILRLNVALGSRKTKAYVWKVMMLKDFTIVTADAIGRVQFWDGKTATMIKSFNVHKGVDVLALTVDAHDNVFSAGVDARIAHYRKVNENWECASLSRPHTHDVCALAVVDAADESGTSSVISGGIDTTLAVLEYKKDDSMNWTQKLTPYPQNPIIELAGVDKEETNPRIMMCQHKDRLDFWLLHPTGEEPVHSLALKTPRNFNIRCSALSKDGSLVALCDAERFRAYSLSLDSKIPSMECLELSPEIASIQSCAMTFGHHNNNLIVTTLKGISVIDLKMQKIVQSLEWAQENLTNFTLFASRCAVTSDNDEWLAVGNTKNNIVIVHLPTMKIHSMLPTMKTPFNCLCFRPCAAAAPQLVVLLPSNIFYVYDVIAKKINERCKQAVESWVPAVMGSESMFSLTFNPSQPSHVILRSHFSMCCVDLDNPMAPSPAQREHKRKNRNPDAHSIQFNPTTAATTSQSASAAAASISAGVAASDMNDLQEVGHDCRKHRMATEYGPMLYTGFLSSDKLMIIERPWIEVLSKFEKSFRWHKYGR